MEKRKTTDRGDNAETVGDDQSARDELWEMVQRIWERNKNVPLEEVEEAVAEAMAEVRGGKPERYR